MASGIYDCFKMDLPGKQVNLATGGDTVKVTLYDNNHAFAATAVTYTTANELATAGGYARGDKSLSGGDISCTSNTVTWDATDISWTSASFTAYHAVIWDSTNTNSLICSIDFGGAETVYSGTFTIQWNSAGIITLA